MKRLFWTPEAIRDREDIYNYIEQDNPLSWSHYVEPLKIGNDTERAFYQHEPINWCC